MTGVSERSRSATTRKRAAARPVAPPRPPAAGEVATVLEAPGERRRASRSLWSACEAFLSSGEPRRMARALDRLRDAFDCDAVAVHVRGRAASSSRGAPADPGAARRATSGTA